MRSYTAQYRTMSKADLLVVIESKARLIRIQAQRIARMTKKLDPMRDKRIRNNFDAIVEYYQSHLVSSDSDMITKVIHGVGKGFLKNGSTSFRLICYLVLPNCG